MREQASMSCEPRFYGELARPPGAGSRERGGAVFLQDARPGAPEDDQSLAEEPPGTHRTLEAEPQLTTAVIRRTSRGDGRGRWRLGGGAELGEILRSSLEALGSAPV